MTEIKSEETDEQTAQMTMESFAQSQSDYETSHIDAAIAEIERVEELENKQAAIAQKKAEIKELDGILMSSEEFCDLAEGGMMFVQTLTHLKSLEFDAEKQEQARDAYKALYEVIRDCPSVRWMLNPASETALRYWRIGSFFVPVSLAVAGELRARKLERQKKTVQTVQKDNGSYSVVNESNYDFAAMAAAEKMEQGAAA